jgi:hypothetical protein
MNQQPEIIERNEMRVRFYLTKLDKKIKEEHQVKKEVLQLELRNKLASMYMNDKEGYEKALKFSGAYIDEKPEEPSKVVVVTHKPITSKL